MATTKKKEKTKISSGYTTKEIQTILNNAKTAHVAKTNDLTKKVPIHSADKLNAPRTYTKKCNGKVEDKKAYFEINGQPLRVELGFTADRDVEITETRLHSGFDTSAYAALKHLYFKGDSGLTLSLTIRLRDSDQYIGEKVNKDIIDYNDKTVFSILSDWCRTFTPCKVVSYSSIVENGYYRIKECNPTQLYNNFITVALVLVQDTYTYHQTLQSQQSMSDINNVINGVGINKTHLSQGTTPKYTGLALQLYNCGELKKECTCITTKKPSCITTYKKCTYILQQALRRVGLYFDGKLDGLYCYITYNAVQKYQKRKKLPVTGKFDSKTKMKLVEDIK